MHFVDFVGPESTNIYRLGTNCTDSTAWRAHFTREQRDSTVAKPV